MLIRSLTTGKRDSKPEIRIDSDLADANGCHTVTVVGSFPTGRSAFLYTYAVLVPSRFAEVIIVEALRVKGIRVELSALSEKHDFKTLSTLYVPANLVANHVSAPLKEEVKTVRRETVRLGA